MSDWYHLQCHADNDSIQSVLAHGLERHHRRYQGYWEARPNHVYIGRMERIRKIFAGGSVLRHGEPITSGDGTPVEWALFAVDLSLVNPSRINPDEDHFGMYSPTGGIDVLRRFRLPFPPCKWAWEWAAYLGIRSPGSLGAWADAIDLGRDREAVAHSARNGSLAIRGVVPPTALRLVGASITEGGS